MKSLYVTDIKPGETLSDETFVIAEVKSATDRNGKPYYDVVLADKTGQIKGKIWSDALVEVQKEALKPGRVVAITAAVEQYKGQSQLNVLSLRGVDESKVEDYLESSILPADQMWQELLEVIAQVQNSHLKSLLEAIVGDKDVAAKLQVWPAALNHHHNFRSGLLQHILEMLALAQGMERFYPDVDFDLVRTGVILHDIGKLEEMEPYGLTTRFTVKGLLLGHVVMGMQLVESFIPKDFPSKLQWHLKHIILSHQGELQFGSPVLPATAEAQMVAMLDMTSTNARKADKGVKEPADELGMTAYNRFLSRWMWADSKE